MAKVTIKKLDVMSVAKVSAAFGAIMGFILGLVAALFSSMLGAVAGIAGMPNVGIAVGFGFLAIIIVPIIYAISGFIGGAISAFVYNIVAERIGGVVFES